MKYKSFKIKFMVDDSAESPLNNQTLPNRFYIERCDRVECDKVETNAPLVGKIDTDNKDGAEFFEYGEEYEIQRGEYYFELNDLSEWSGDIELAKSFIRALAEELHYYHSGEVYGYAVKYKGEVLDSCWGFYAKEWAEQSAKDFIDSYSVESLVELDLPAKLVLR